MGKLFDVMVRSTESSYKSWLRSGIGQHIIEIRDQYDESCKNSREFKKG